MPSGPLFLLPLIPRSSDGSPGMRLQPGELSRAGRIPSCRPRPEIGNTRDTPMPHLQTSNPPGGGCPVRSPRRNLRAPRPLRARHGRAPRRRRARAARPARRSPPGRGKLIVDCLYVLCVVVYMLICFPGRAKGFHARARKGEDPSEIATEGPSENAAEDPLEKGQLFGKCD